MTVPVRGTKTSAGGGTAFAANTNALAAEVNTDFDALYNVLNAGLENDNIAAAAAIALTKLDDISSSDANHAATTTPGDSTSHTLPTTLSGELQQLRYALERLALGNDAKITSSATEAFWGDVPARGPNLLRNGGFEARMDSAATPANLPDGWTNIADSPTFSRVATAVVNGKGSALRVVAGGATVQGVQQTLTGLKASTRYLVIARALVTTGTAHLKTLNADAATFDDLDLTTTSATYATLKGVIVTNSTPTDIVVQLATDGGATDDVRWDNVGVYECSADFLTEPTGYPTAISNWTATSPTWTSGAWTTLTGANFPSLAVVLPSHSFEIHVDLDIQNVSSGVGDSVVELLENGTTVAPTYHPSAGAGYTATHHLSIARPGLTPGTTYTYTVRGRTSAGTRTPNTALGVTDTPSSRMMVRLVRIT